MINSSIIIHNLLQFNWSDTSFMQIGFTVNNIKLLVNICVSTKEHKVPCKMHLIHYMPSNFLFTVGKYSTYFM